MKIWMETSLKMGPYAWDCAGMVQRQKPQWRLHMRRLYSFNASCLLADSGVALSC